MSFLLFFDTFRIQGILLFLLFPDTFGKGWKVRRLESWKVGRLEGWKVGGLKGWKVGRLKAGRLGGWVAGRLEGWKVGRLDGKKVGRLESWNVQGVLSFPQVIIADRACVTVFKRRSH